MQQIQMSNFFFCPRLQYVWRCCPASKSLVQHADGAQGIQGRRRAFRSFFQAWKTTDAVTGVIFFSSYFPVVAGGEGEVLTEYVGFG